MLAALGIEYITCMHIHAVDDQTNHGRKINAGIGKKLSRNETPSESTIFRLSEKVHFNVESLRNALLDHQQVSQPGVRLQVRGGNPECSKFNNTCISIYVTTLYLISVCIC
jgi:hypothetical protein